MRIVPLIVVATSLVACGGPSRMTFFVTSAPPLNGGAIGGLAGADAHCQRLADAVGAPKRVWRAYLSTAADASGPGVDARDRIGRGPWKNAKGVQVAGSLEELHGAGNGLGGRTSLDEHGGFVPSNAHDILTGSNADGTVSAGDATCHNWSTTEGRAMVGHSNRVGNLGGDRARSWNSAHLSEGCTREALNKTGGAGLLYCFAER
jgi:hypothetical protein